ncbi:MAG: hypothetical protein ACLPJW_12680 [Rhodomicrobium sp.]
MHHVDGNACHNRLANLECLPAKEHLSRTWRDTRSGGTEHFSALARQKATEWHKSDAGRLWHKRHAERSKNWTKWIRKTKPCENCGKEFEALIRESGYGQKFCHPNCKAAHYRKRKAAGEV